MFGTTREVDRLWQEVLYHLNFEVTYNSGASYLARLDLQEQSLQSSIKFLDIVYSDDENMTAERFFLGQSEHDNQPFDRNRAIPGVRPTIKAVITDWDGTVGDYYEYIAYAVSSLLDYMSYTRKIDRTELDAYLINLGKTRAAPCFEGPSYFSVNGARDILRSEQVAQICPRHIDAEHLACLDEMFLENIFSQKLSAAYSHIYDDAVKFFNDLHSKDVPIFIHSDSPLSEMLKKLEESKMATFDYDSDGNIIAVRNCLFAGLSAKRDRAYGEDAARKEQSLIKAFSESGIDLIVNSPEECKPNPAPLSKIQSSLQKQGYGWIQPKEMLMIGDFMSKDGYFALNSGTYFAWSGERAIKSDVAVDVNKVTASADIGYRNNISKQFEVFTNNVLGGDEQKMRQVADVMAIYVDYSCIPNFFDFQSTRNGSREISFPNISVKAALPLEAPIVKPRNLAPMVGIQNYLAYQNGR